MAPPWLHSIRKGLYGSAEKQRWNTTGHIIQVFSIGDLRADRCACQLVAGLLAHLANGDNDEDGFDLLDALTVGTGILKQVVDRFKNTRMTLEG